MSVMYNIVGVAILDIFHVKNMTSIFDPSRSSNVKSDGANRKPMATFRKVLPVSNLVSVTVFEIFRVK